MTVILTSQMAVIEVEIPNQKSQHPFMVRDCLPQPLAVIKITTAKEMPWKWRNVVMVKNHDKNDVQDHEMSGFIFEMLMPIMSKRYKKFLWELPTAICDR